MADVSRGFTSDGIPRQVRAETRKAAPTIDQEGMGAAVCGTLLAILGVLAAAVLCALAEAC